MTRKYVKPCKRDEQISMQLSIKTASYENLGSESFNLSSKRLGSKILQSSQFLPFWNVSIDPTGWEFHI